MPFRKRILAFWTFLVVLVGVLGTPLKLAHAHAEYERSEPPAGAVIPKPPSKVHVWFTQELFRRAGANTLEVYGPDGSQVDRQDARIDDDDRTHMSVSLSSNLLAGAYTVRWSTLSVEDGDTDNGEFSFTVDPAAAQATLQPSPTLISAPSPTLSPVSTPPPPANSGLPCLGGVALGGLVVGLIIGPSRRNRGTA